MRWLSLVPLARVVRGNVRRQLSQDGSGGENGAIAALVAVLFLFGVLLGLGSLVIDTGSLLYERRQLQNGADAAVLAVAKDCASNPACTPNSVAGLAALTALAGANASSDGQTAIASSVCGNSIARLSFPGLADCPALTDQIVDCPPVPSRFASEPYIEVRTKTLNADGTFILPPILAQMLAGGTYSGETVKACSRAALLPASTPIGFVLPVAFSYCQFSAATGYVAPVPPGLGTPAVLQSPPTSGQVPGYGNGYVAWPTRSTDEVLLFTQSPGHPVGICNTWNSHVAPGTFGQLVQVSCNANVITGNWVQGANGNPAPCDLSVLDALRGRVVSVPIFDCYTPNKFDWPWTDPATRPPCNDTSPGSWYHITGYASLYLTGFNFSGSSQEGKSIFPNSSNYNSAPCNGSDRCISGWFTQGSLSTDPWTGDTLNLGTYQVQLAG